ncbi:50S ribosomal protein L14e [Candidatus Bathyarchaeota archaeon]|jgi:large subunit ribosomal protein L14e|nr:50S ribosomal protein L14e [Candidatus Bathyarchaeota archaeon]
MVAIEVGRICVKTAGREIGKRCVIVDVIDKNYVLVTGPKSLSGVKRRRTNVNHMEPTEDKIDLKRDATDEEVLKALEKAEKTAVVKASARTKTK